MTHAMQATTPSLDADTKRMVEDSFNRFVDEAYEPSVRLKRLQRPTPVQPCDAEPSADRTGLRR